MGETYNRLNRKQETLLAIWLQKSDRMLQQEGKTYAEGAEMAAAEVGFAVTSDNVKKLTKDLDLSWRGNESKSVGMAPFHAKMRNTEAAAQAAKDTADKCWARLDGVEAKLATVEDVVTKPQPPPPPDCSARCADLEQQVVRLLSLCENTEKVRRQQQAEIDTLRADLAKLYGYTGHKVPPGSPLVATRPVSQSGTTLAGGLGKANSHK